MRGCQSKFAILEGTYHEKLLVDATEDLSHKGQDATSFGRSGFDLVLATLEGAQATACNRFISRRHEIAVVSRIAEVSTGFMIPIQLDAKEEG
jgi:hypothetical protein